MPELSVVIPSYNNARTIDETVRSILEQDHDSFELIVADHSSTDDTRRILEQFESDPRVTIMHTPAGGGAPANWNAVSDRASGQFFKLVCGDDVVLPGALRRQSQLLRSTGAVMTSSRRNVTDASGRILKRDWGLRGIAKRMPGEQAVRVAVRAGSNVFGEPASAMMTLEAFRSAGGWDGRFPYLIDQTTYSRVLMRGEYVPDLVVGATFRMSANQWSVALVREQARQMRLYNHWLREEYPSSVSAADVRIGDTASVLMANARRLAYRVFDRRMR